MMLYEKNANKIHNLEFLKSIRAEVLYDFNDGDKKKVPSIVLDDGSGTGYFIRASSENHAKKIINEINEGYRNGIGCIEV